MNSTKNLITIIGTTGVGKSQFSIELAKALNGEIINGDSMQVYRGLDNITNKHPIEERENITHHLLGHCSWNDEYSVQQFEKEALKIIEDILSRGKLPILVGGTHYYNQAIMFKNATLTSDTNTQSEMNLTKEQMDILNGPSPLVLQNLKKHDPLVAEKFHPNDTRRIRRALEVFYTTGSKASTIYLNQKNDALFENQSTSNIENIKLNARYRTMVFWIWSEQQVLNKRLDDRVDDMIKNGLVDEIDEMYQEYVRLSTSTQGDTDLSKGIWQVIGFRQFLPWLESNKSDPKLFDMCVDEMKRNTRRYSKQQTKFMKNTLMPKINEVMHENLLYRGKKNSIQMDSNTRSSLVATILDASDLTQWNTNVGSKGISLAKKFVNNQLNDTILVDEKELSLDESEEPKNDEADQLEDERPGKNETNYKENDTQSNNHSFTTLKNLLITPKKFTHAQWKTFTCEICTRQQPTQTPNYSSLDSTSTAASTTVSLPYIAVGQQNWETHLRSRKHKNMIQKIAKMNRNQVEIEKRKKKNGLMND